MEAITTAGVKEGGQLTGQPPAVRTGSLHIQQRPITGAGKKGRT